MDDVKTSIRVGDGPEVSIDLKKDINDPLNAAAKEQMTGLIKNALGRGTTVAADQLRLFIERIERLEEEKRDIADDIKDVYAEAKANGYDSKIMRIIVRLRKMETHTRQEQVAILDTYASALGLQGVLPL